MTRGTTPSSKGGVPETWLTREVVPTRRRCADIAREEVKGVQRRFYNEIGSPEGTWKGGGRLMVRVGY